MVCLQSGASTTGTAGPGFEGNNGVCWNSNLHVRIVIKASTTTHFHIEHAYVEELVQEAT